MLIESPNSVNVYQPASSVDAILGDGEYQKKNGGTNVVTDLFYLLQVPQTSHSESLYAKSVREKFMDYFVNDGGSRIAMEILLRSCISFHSSAFISNGSHTM